MVVLVNNEGFCEKREFPFRLPVAFRDKQWYCAVNKAIRPKFLGLKAHPSSFSNRSSQVVGAWWRNKMLTKSA